MESEEKTNKTGAASDAQDESPSGETTQAEGEEQPQQAEAQSQDGASAGANAEGSSLEAELEATKNRAADNWDKFVRLQAEFENFKKRIHKEQADSLKFAHLPVLREMAGILDNFERAIDHARTNPTPELEGMISGIDMVVQQMVSAFEKFGMTRIKALGETFDPTCHEAMSIKETDEVPENQVVEEFQSGYLLHDRVVRPAMVVVSKKPAAGNDSAS